MLTLNNLDIASSPLSPSKYLHRLKDQQSLLEIFFFRLLLNFGCSSECPGRLKKKKIPTLDYLWRLVWYSVQALVFLQISSDDSNVKSGLKVVFRDAHRPRSRPSESETWYVAQWSVFSCKLSRWFWCTLSLKIIAFLFSFLLGNICVFCFLFKFYTCL